MTANNQLQPATPDLAPDHGNSARRDLLIVLLIWLPLFGLRAFAPADLTDIGFERTVAYVQDIVQNGNWICQHDLRGNITSKPSLHAWVVAIFTLPWGYVNHFTICLVAGLSTLLVAVMILAAGRQYFGARAGLLGAAVYLLSAAGIDQLVWIRTDALFVCTVTATALAAFRAWKLGRGWTWFWLAAAATTLVKGPLGVLVAGIGLLAVVWERRGGRPAALSGSHRTGIVLFLAITLGWFGLAYLQEGWPLVNKMIGRELIGQGVAGISDIAPGEEFYKPLLYFLGRFAPWCIFALLGFWRVLWRPSDNDCERRFERFLLCWFVVPLVLFSLAIHQQPRHIFPILPAAALLAGRELARLLASARDRTVIACCAIGVLVAAAIVVYESYLHVPRAKHVARTRGMKEWSRSLEEKVGKGFSFIHVDSPIALQYYLETRRPFTPIEKAAELLEGPQPVFVVVHKYDLLLKHLSSNGAKLHVLDSWPPSGQPYLRIVSNHPRLERRKDISQPR